MATEVGIDAAWVRDEMGEKDCEHAELEALQDAGGFTGHLFFLRTTHANGEKRQRIVKTFLGEAKLRMSKDYGLPREALFLQEFVQNNKSDIDERIGFLRSKIPRVFYAKGDLQSGHKLIVMELLEGYHTGKVFAEHHPGSWKRPSETFQYSAELERGLTADSFKLAAEFHATFWMDSDIRNKWGSFLRNKDHGLESSENSEHWNKAQALTREKWEWVRKNILDPQQALLLRGDTPAYVRPRDDTCTDPACIRLDPHLVDVVEACLSRPATRTGLDPAFPFWTLTHGDFWPNNIFYCTNKNPEERLKLLDFESVGIGSCAQDIGQYMISNTRPEDRRLWERSLVCDVYHATLVQLLESRGTAPDLIPTVEQVWEEYKSGGVERWVFFLAHLLTSCPPHLGQYFADQLASFVTDHFPDPQAIGGLRF